MKIEQIGDTNYLLGEGPLWDPRDASLYFVDAAGKSIWRYRPESGDFKEWKLPDVVSSLALCDSGGAIITLADGFYAFDFENGAHERIGDAIESDLDTRFNDGKVDRQGRFIAGTMHTTIKEYIGSLYSLGTDRAVTKLDTGIACTNGPCFSLDGQTLYFTDTRRREIYAYDYDTETGGATNKRVFANMRDLGTKGAPDGCTVDSEGYLWSAQCTGSVIARLTPDGALDRVIDMPVQNVTSVMFGGEKLDVLYVTSLRTPMPGAPSKAPNEGALFAVHGLGFTGVPEPRFAG